MSELASFYEFMGHKMREFGSSVSPEEMLDLWRANHPSKADLERDIRAVQAAIDAMNAGDVGATLSDFDRDFREKHSLA